MRQQLLTRSPAEIAAEIWTSYELRLSDQKRKNDPYKVLEDVKFGIYGYTEKLFADCTASNSFYSTVLSILRVKYHVNQVCVEFA